MASTFDEAELMERVDNDVGFLAETVRMLTSDGPGLVDEIRRALAAADAPTVGRAAHTLKGMISNFCAPAAHASALAVERLGKEGDLGPVPAALEALDVDLAALTKELVEFLEART